MNDSLKPIYLLADSQLLFWKQHGSVFLESVRSEIVKESPKAAYVGASNDDQPEFYQIFEAGMEGIGIRDCRMIRASFPDDDAAFNGGIRSHSSGRRRCGDRLERFSTKWPR
jgi:hypothetical protein